jgi:hypothetical protein
MALNFGAYRLLPMLNRSGDSLRFEFFGHGIVELARLTTGKSTREVEEIAEFLVHAGYNPGAVDSFLKPLMEARKGSGPGGERRYAATIDSHGELINEGIVLTLQFLMELEKERDNTAYDIVHYDDLDWAAFQVDARDSNSLYVGLRLLGVARLKGLSPQELVEAVVWEELPASRRPEQSREPLVDLLRRLNLSGNNGVEEAPEEHIPEDLLVITYLLPSGDRTWVFGEYRHSDAMILHAIQAPIQTPELSSGEPLETWLFRNRFELARLYDGIRRESTGTSTPIDTLRTNDQFLACFLAAPHRSP